MVYLIALVVYGLDQWLKWLVRTHLQLDHGFPVIKNVLYIDYIRNPGAAWGILPHARWLLILIAIVVMAAVIYAQRRFNDSWLAKIGLALVLGGALGNLTDRVLTGTVVDYVYFSIINFPVFNLADSAIDVGVILLLWYSLRRDRVKKHQSSEEEEASS